MHENLVAALRPLVDRLSQSSYWRKGKNGPRHIAEPFTPTRLMEHVAGTGTYGLAPIAPGESTTRVALLDLDSHKGETPWEEMCGVAQRLIAQLEHTVFRPVAFRSSGGKGIHIIMVWDAPQDAYSVRQSLTEVLALEGLTNGAGGLIHKEVEIFPKQDAVPLDGCGNMFILPLAGESLPLSYDLAGVLRVMDRKPLAPEMWTPSSPVPIYDRPPRVTPPIEIPPDLKRLEAALATIPNDASLDYDNWRNIIFSIHAGSGGSDAGLALAHKFSGQSPKHDPEFLDTRVWPYINSGREGGITERSLYHAAAQRGWQDPAIADDFDVEPPYGNPLSPTLSDDTDLKAAPTKGYKYPVITAGEFIKGQPLTWIIKGILPTGELGVIFGESGSGKSFITLDMAAAIVQGVPWRGQRISTPLRAVYIAAEGVAGVRKRLRAYQEHHAVDLDQYGLGIIAGAPNFMVVEEINEVMASIRAFGNVGVIFVDTLAQVTPGANENSGEDMGKALSHCKAIHRATKAIVILIHHAGKDASKGARGWSGIRAAADFEMEIVRRDHDRVATVTKLKDGEDGADMPFRLVTVDLGVDQDGDPVNSCIVAHEERAARSTGPREPSGATQRLVWKCFHDLADFGDGTVPVDSLMLAAVAKVPREAGARDTRSQHIRRALMALADGNWLSIDGEIVSTTRQK